MGEVLEEWSSRRSRIRQVHEMEEDDDSTTLINELNPFELSPEQAKIESNIVILKAEDIERREKNEKCAIMPLIVIQIEYIKKIRAYKINIEQQNKL